MNSETKHCQNCKKPFMIEPEDFGFYEKIKVPPPTFCPECRLIVRRTFRNERTLYHRDCGLCGRSIISMFSVDVPFPVHCQECWWSDKWDPMDYGSAVDFSKPFFEQLKDLQSRVPRSSLTTLNNTNSPYLNYAWFSNNSYMCWDLGYGDNVLYSNACHFLKDSADCSYSKKIELCYECINSKECSRSAYLKDCENCLDSYFLRGCKNCSSCILCDNLRNKNYCVEDRQYSKEEYEKIKDSFIGDFDRLEASKKTFFDRLSKSIVKENSNVQATNCTGYNIWQCKNCHHSFNVFKSENCRFVNDIDSDLKDSMDLSNAAEGELMYAGTSVSGRNLLFNVFAASSFDVYYSVYAAKNDNNLFGCVSLFDKSHCILNKQYTKGEYEVLVPKIVKHMNDLPYVDKLGRTYRYGEFFPPELSPFAYNETLAQEYFPLTKKQAIGQGYRWKEPETKSYKVTMSPADLPKAVKDVPDSIVNEVIGCAHAGKCNQQCTTAFKVVPQELLFYRRMNIPLPRLCPNCRHYERLAQRNPMKLWRRGCACDKTNHTHQGKCPVEFETSYAPDRKEIVYCEACYQNEVV
jgi:hypothetical protein